MVKELNIGYNSFMNQIELMELAGLTPGNIFPFLERVNVASCRIYDGFIEQLTLAMPKLLSELDLSGCANITDTSLILLSTRCKNLSILKLSRCPLVTDVGVEFLAEQLGANLVDLSVTHCPAVTDRSASKLAEFCPCLKALDIGYTGVTAQGVDAVARSLIQVETLGIACLPLPVPLFRSLFRRLPALRDLNVSFCFTLTENDLVVALEQFIGVISAFGFDLSDDNVARAHGRIHF